jgi:hypothetical protein
MTQPTEDTLDLLACDIELRPVGAPGVDALAAAIRGVERNGETLVVSFAADARKVVERFAAAERQCCALIRWDVEHAADGVWLRVGAASEQLDVLEAMFRTARC